MRSTVGGVTMESGLRVPMFAMFAVALVCLVAAIWKASGAALFLKDAVAVQAEVIRVENDSESGQRDGTSRPVLRWLDASREPIEWRGPSEKGRSSFGVGDKVDLLVAKGDVIIDRFANLWQGSIVLLVFVWFMGGIGVLMRMMGGHDEGVMLAAMLLFGLPMLVGSVASAGVLAYDLRHGERATAEVLNGRGVPWRLFKEGESATVTPGELRFTAADGRVVEVVDPNYNATFATVGERVGVVHPRGRPYAARVVDGLEYWLAPIVLGAFGAVFTGAGLLLRRAFGRP